MTQSDIYSAYNQIKDLSIEEIQDIVDDKHDSLLGMFAGGLVGSIACGAVCPGTSSDGVTSNHKLKSICKKTLSHYKEEVKQIVNNHRKQATCILDILILVAPAVAQQVAGLSALTIVGTLTILIKESLLA